VSDRILFIVSSLYRQIKNLELRLQVMVAFFA